ncbi:GerMN domain-containing protein [Geosporobacter ferrireducens]|uniref:GerMN domain-containing protein n=1 Tax=Geosporobacter ferrireducens TaxID=1424294 RepID=UPI00235683D1|nr:GerMN domain-containing protein [Geosporobacter ferrireducens]
MLRSIFNLFLVFIICITASGIPVNVDAFDFSLPLPSTNTSISYVTNLNTDSLENPSTIQLEIHGITPMELTYEGDQRLLLEVFQDNQQIANINGNDLIIETNELSSAVEENLEYTLDISQQKLNLPNGNYVFHIRSLAQELKKAKPFILNVSYVSIAKYIPASNSIAQGTMALHLGFTDSDYQYLIPVTRVVPYDRAVLRTVIDQLRTGPDPALGLTGLPVPEVKKLSVTKDLLTVNWTADAVQAAQGSSVASLASDGIIQSLTAVSGINRIKFLVDGKESDELFHGVGTRTIFTADKAPKIYLAYDNQKDRMLLVPYRMQSKDRDTLVQEVFTGLKTAEVQGTAAINLKAVLPSQIELLDFAVHNKVLALNLSKEFLDAHPSRTDLQRMIIDAILYSFTSIDGIDKVQIKVEGNAVDSFASISLSQAIKRPLFINPER